MTPHEPTYLNTRHCLIHSSILVSMSGMTWAGVLLFLLTIIFNDSCYFTTINHEEVHWIQPAE